MTKSCPEFKGSLESAKFRRSVVRRRDNVPDNSPVSARLSPPFPSKPARFPLCGAGLNPALSAKESATYVQLRDNAGVTRIVNGGLIANASQSIAPVTLRAAWSIARNAARVAATFRQDPTVAGSNPASQANHSARPIRKYNAVLASSHLGSVDLVLDIENAGPTPP